MKVKKSYLQKVEKIFEELGYRVRYEKGNFQSGYCHVHNSNVVVINKFFDPTGRFEILVSILEQIKIEYDKLSCASRNFLADNGLRSQAK